jgi:hypothetical protein
MESTISTRLLVHKGCCAQMIVMTRSCVWLIGGGVGLWPQHGLISPARTRILSIVSGAASFGCSVNRMRVSNLCLSKLRQDIRG